MDPVPLLKPLGGWYSSHWGLAPVGLHRRPFTVPSAGHIQQPLADLQELYNRALFLLGITGRFPLPCAPSSQSLPPPREQVEVGGGGSAKPAPRTAAVPEIALTLPSREKMPLSGPEKPCRLSRLPAAGPGPPSSPQTSDGDFQVQAEQGVPEQPADLSAQVEVLLEAVTRLREALNSLEFLTPALRESGAEVIDRFARSLAPFGLKDTEGALTLDRDRWAQALKDNPRRVAEALGGPYNLTPELTSLAAAIVGAPGIFLVQAAYPAPETYQPFQAPNPWFRVAPAHFHQVA